MTNLQKIEKKKTINLLLISTILFFIIVNAESWLIFQPFWSSFYSVFILLSPITILMMVIPLFLGIRHTIKERYKDKRKNIKLIVATVLLVLSISFPNGVLPAALFEAQDDIVANWEQMDGCNLTIKLKEHKHFLMEDYCLGIRKYSGTYEIKGDTILFNYNNDSRGGIYYGVLLKEQDSIGNYVYKELLTYDKDTGKRPLHFAITKYAIED